MQPPPPAYGDRVHGGPARANGEPACVDGQHHQADHDAHHHDGIAREGCATDAAYTCYVDRELALLHGHWMVAHTARSHTQWQFRARAPRPMRVADTE